MTTPTRPNFPSDEIADGDCFTTAANIVSLFDVPFAMSSAESKAREMALAIGRTEHSIYLMHGYVTRPTDGVRHVHAWVEIPDVRLVLDYSNGLEVMTPIAHYYKAGKINNDHVRSYGYYDTRQLLVEHGHYGPWEDIDDTEPSDD